MPRLPRALGAGPLGLASLLAVVLACGPSPDESPFPPSFNESGGGGQAASADPEASAGAAGAGTRPEGTGELPLGMTGSGGSGAPSMEQPGDAPPGASGGTRNLFSELLGVSQAEVDAKVTQAVNRFFGIGTGESATPNANEGFRVYYELPQDPSQAFIWAADTDDIRSEGMSYGMFIAVQMNMRDQFNRLWKFAQTHMQYAETASGNLAAWRYYFRWQGSVNTTDAQNWIVQYGAQTGPAPDGEEYFAAALYLAHRRWGSEGGVDYRRDAENLSRAMLDNARSGSRTPVIHPDQNMVVFYPQGNTANFSDPSYHLPAFYELFALDGPAEHAARWRQVAEISREFLVRSAHPSTGLHPDYANFDGTPNAGGSNHDDFRFDAWRVVMNMAVDHAWFSGDERMRAQVEKYHTFFQGHLGQANVENQIFELDGSSPSGGGSTALTATLGAGALASTTANRARYVDNLWRVQQQRGLYRYYQESVYLLGLLAAAGYFDYDFGSPAP